MTSVVSSIVRSHMSKYEFTAKRLVLYLYKTIYIILNL
jgi:hypothetical protein